MPVRELSTRAISTPRGSQRTGVLVRSVLQLDERRVVLVFAFASRAAEKPPLPRHLRCAQPVRSDHRVERRVGPCVSKIHQRSALSWKEQDSPREARSRLNSLSCTLRRTNPPKQTTLNPTQGTARAPGRGSARDVALDSKCSHSKLRRDPLIGTLFAFAWLARDMLDVNSSWLLQRNYRVSMSLPFSIF